MGLIAEVLPYDARSRLIAASQITNDRERTAAVQEAVVYAQQKYPQFFQVKEQRQ